MSVDVEKSNNSVPVSLRTVALVQAFEDKDRRLKILHFDKHGKALFALCEPIGAAPSHPNSDNQHDSDDVTPLSLSGSASRPTTSAVSAARRHLELIRVPTTECPSQAIQTCRRLTVRADGFQRRLRDVAYSASQDGAMQFGVVYVVEPAVGAGALWDEASRLKNINRSCNQKRYLVTLDIENQCRPSVSELVWPSETNRNPALRKSELKLFHLTKKVGWILVEIRFDTENGCEFLTFNTLDFTKEPGRAELKELMSYSAEEYYVALTVQSCLFYIFQIGSTRVTVYDASADAFLRTVIIPVLSHHIFKMDDYLYLFPHFWHDANFSKTSPKCLFVFDGCKWTETNMVLDDDHHCNGEKCKGHVTGFSKDVWVSGSTAGLIAVGSSSRNKPLQRTCTNYYHIYEITKRPSQVKRLKELAFGAVSKNLPYEYLVKFGLPDSIFREFVGPLWLKKDNFEHKCCDEILLP